MLLLHGPDLAERRCGAKPGEPAKHGEAMMGSTRYMLLPGMFAGICSMAALALLSTCEGHGPLRPVNATSHWLYGAAAARHRRYDRSRTWLGLTTHLASSLFWAVPFEYWLAKRPARTPAGMLRGGAVVAACAAAFDYLLMPRRLTPGWELAVSKLSVVGGFAGLSLGFAAGGLLAQSMRH